jgi:putative colanic acid biosynthesis acetyltransferase WcaF
VARISIGSNTTISQKCFLCTASHNYSFNELPLISSEITIGNNVWITADVFVGPGIDIGDGSVVLARSTVVQDLPPWIVAKGNPATPFKARELVDVK